MIKVGIFGIGTVGTALIKQLQNIENIEIAGIFSRSKKDLPYLQYDDWQELVEASDIVVELIGGIDIAKEIIFYALQKNKKIVTANKYLLSEYGKEILLKYPNSIKFEAAVCSILPIIRMVEYLKNSQITEIAGILNGTSNYVLTQVDQKNISFENALKKAQQLGYAESDPSFDINGLDALQKAQILHFLAFGFWANNCQAQEIHKANKAEKSIAHITKNRVVIDNKCDDNFLAVNDNYNAVNIKTELMGEFFLKGIGAGGLETAYSVKQDILQFARG